MRAAELKELLNQKPFVPLLQRIDVGVDPDPQTGVLRRVDHYSLIRLIRVEELVQEQSTGGNGQKTD